MASQSKHIEEIMSKHNRTSNIQVVFLDIEKYSKRRSLTQIGVIDSFTTCLQKALVDTAKQYIGYAQDNGINFQSDIVSLPTGDGAAIIFSFDGLHDIHLFFAKRFLEINNELNENQVCDKFIEQGWCNCHPDFFVRIGVSEGKGILYKDINSGYNVAGDVINMAARVMGLADRSQIVFTETAFRQIVDMVDDPALVDRFVEFRKVTIKHGIEMNVYQYIGTGEQYINPNAPGDLAMRIRMDAATDKMKALGIPIPGEEVEPEIFKQRAVNMMEGVANILAGVMGLEPLKQVEAKPVEAKLSIEEVEKQSHKPEDGR